MAATTPNLFEIKQKASAWAKERLADPQTVIIDLESTGILSKDPETEVVQLSLINTAGRPLLSMMLKPLKPMNEEVQAIHGIRNEWLYDKPFFLQVAKIISCYLQGKHVVSYNMDFDWKLLMHMYAKYDEEKPQIAGASCCLDRYSEWCGEWSTSKGNFKWQKLPNLSGMPAHDALTDCISTLKVMQKMAGIFDEAAENAELLDLDF